MSVVLPEPFSPKMCHNLAVPDGQINLIVRHDASECFRDLPTLNGILFCHIVTSNEYLTNFLINFSKKEKEVPQMKVDPFEAASFYLLYTLGICNTRKRFRTCFSIASRYIIP